MFGPGLDPIIPSSSGLGGSPNPILGFLRQGPELLPCLSKNTTESALSGFFKYRERQSPSFCSPREQGQAPLPQASRDPARALTLCFPRQNRHLAGVPRTGLSSLFPEIVRVDLHQTRQLRISGAGAREEGCVATPGQLRPSPLPRAASRSRRLLQPSSRRPLPLRPSVSTLLVP